MERAITVVCTQYTLSCKQLLDTVILKVCVFTTIISFKRKLYVAYGQTFPKTPVKNSGCVPGQGYNIIQSKLIIKPRAACIYSQRRHSKVLEEQRGAFEKRCSLPLSLSSELKHRGQHEIALWLPGRK